MARTRKLYVGAKLREIRVRLNLTQAEYAAKLGVSLSYLNQMENNHRPVSARVILSLAQEFGINVAEIAAGSTERLVADLREALADPVGATMDSWTRPNGMTIARVRVPLVVAVLLVFAGATFARAGVWSDTRLIYEQALRAQSLPRLKALVGNTARVLRRAAGTEAAEVQRPAEDEATRAMDTSTGGEEPIWHVVLNGEQQGPYSVPQVREMLAGGHIDAETYVWRDGFDGWLPMQEVAELAGVVVLSPEETRALRRSVGM